MTQPSVAVVGLGYIGLPTALVLANSGLRVTGIDTNEETVAKINRGEITIVEPGLEAELGRASSSGNFRASSEYVHADVYIVAVPTPFTSNHHLDISFINSAADAIAPHLRGGELIILESTSPPLTTEKLANRILDLRPDLIADNLENSPAQNTIFFAHCPERILPGRALEELTTNDRIIGGQTPRATEKAIEVYSKFCKGKLHETDDVTAEMTKLTENAFRDVNIAFANELSIISSKVGVNVWELISLANRHPRVDILQPGPGVGGHCIAVDPWFLVATDPDNSRLIQTAREVNDSKPGWVMNRIQEALNSAPSSPVAILGLSFKANIDDLRGSPAVQIATEIAKQNVEHKFFIVEPHIEALPKTLANLDNVKLSQLNEALSQAKTVVLLVDHHEFLSIPRTVLLNKICIDTRGVWK